MMPKLPTEDPDRVTLGLYPYLKSTTLDPARSWQSIKDALGTSSWEALLQRAGSTSAQFETDAENADNDFYEVCERVDQVIADDERRSVLEYLHRNDPTQAPSWSYFSTPSLVRPDVWLIHFTEDARSIQEEGFTRGVNDVTQLGLTTFLSDTEKDFGGYAFAFVANSRDARNAGQKYGSQAVMFRAVGVKAYHNGDDENQVIFWGPSVDPTGIVALTPDPDTGDWCVVAYGRMQDRGRSCAFRGPLARAISWVEANHAQYARHLHARRL